MTEERLKVKLSEAKMLNRELAKTNKQKQRLIDKLLTKKTEALYDYLNEEPEIARAEIINKKDNRLIS